VTDAHCHLAVEAYASDLDAVVARAREAGVSRALCVLSAGDAGEMSRAERVAEAWPGVRFAAGIHPHVAREVADLGEVDRTVAAALGAIGDVVAIGEIGLDYHYDLSPRHWQCEVFRRQLWLARDRGLPVVIHTREADADTLAILRDERPGLVGGVFHCFSGDRVLLDAALDLGFDVSLSGMVTFAGAERLRALSAAVPLDRLLVETDGPYLAPAPHRGRRNEPAWVVHTAEVVAGARGEPVTAVEAAVEANFARLFGVAAVATRVDTPRGSMV
jgi:TatD DNase family protein